jgi:alkaline phosphatase
MHPVFTDDSTNIVATGEKTAAYWLAQARGAVEARAHRPLNTKKAKNVIMFLGDGMSHQTIGRIQRNIY